MGKTSKKTQDTVQAIDPALQRESHSLVNLFRLIAGGGYQPNRGVTVAGFTPGQEAAFNMRNAANKAFGFEGMDDPMAGVPETETSAMGIEGYRPAIEYDESVALLPQWFKDIIDLFQQRIGRQSRFVEFKPKTSSSGGKKA